jgi:hypothetical protein
MPKPLQGISTSRFAKEVGVTERAVRKAKHVGRVVMFADGSIDLEKSLKTWTRNADPARGKVRVPRTGTSPESGADSGSAPDNASPGDVPPVKDKASAYDAVQLVKDVISQEGGDDKSLVDFGMARTAESILKSRERELKLRMRRGELVEISRVRDHVQKAFIAYRQSIQRLPARHAASIAAEVGCDPAALDKALQRVIQTELELMSAPVVQA